MYVGLGGTGLKIGTHLEQVLRLEMCGADGRELAGHPAFGGTLEPYELPQFVQFVYADFDEADRKATERASARLARDLAARRTATYIDKLTPDAGSYQDAAASLRTSCYPQVKDWLPGPENEPLVSPLGDGAGQFPTVGRAALFETLRSEGFRIIEQPLEAAISNLANAGGPLDSYLGRPAQAGCDVFVGFSLAGGTGGGIAQDFLRLVSWKVAETFGSAPAAGVHIYPLVVLPSAFDGSDGGGREAMLNGGPALRDLFALVDRCNTGVPNPHFAYPQERAGGVPPAVPARTAFVFNKPTAIELGDLYRSITAFVVSLVGTELQAGAGQGFSSFASAFVNRGGQLRTKAPDGIGYRPASAALAAHLSIPVDEIADLLSSRLLARATADLETPRQNEDNHRQIEELLAAAGLNPLVLRAADDALDNLPSDAEGAKDIRRNLELRRTQAAGASAALESRLASQVGRLADKMDLATGVRAIAGKSDFFRIARIVLGDHRITSDAVSSGGVIGFLDRRGLPVKDKEGRPPGNQPPGVPALHDHGPMGVLKLKSTDETVRAAIADQEQWYNLRVRHVWHMAWSAQSEARTDKTDSIRRAIANIRDAFTRHADNEPSAYKDSCQQLYAAKKGIVYFLPDGGTESNLDHFYETYVLPGLRQRVGAADGADEGTILNALLGDKWLRVFELGMSQPETAVTSVLDEVGQEVAALLTGQGADDQALLPTLDELLVAAANADGVATGMASTVGRFRTILGSLLPAGFEPEGDGPLQIQIFYPALAQATLVQGYLGSLFSQRGNVSYYQVADSSFLGVVLTRVAIPATAVGEFRDLMLLWAQASDAPQQADYLPWRSPLGNHSHSIALTEADEIDVLVALLNAMWDGSISVLDGDDRSPNGISISQIDGAPAAAITFDLEPFGQLSSWTNVLRAYERFALGGGSVRTQQCGQLMNRVAPTKSKPSNLYETFRALVVEQADLADRTISAASEASRPLMTRATHFWSTAIPAALEKPLGAQAAGGPIGACHLDFYRPTPVPARDS